MEPTNLSNTQPDSSSELRPNVKQILWLLQMRFDSDKIWHVSNTSDVAFLAARTPCVYSQTWTPMASQDEPVSEQSAESYKSRLWIFHAHGVSIHSIGCSGLLHGKRNLAVNLPSALFCYLNSRELLYKV